VGKRPAEAFADDGYVVLVDAVPEPVRRAALRLLNLEIRSLGLTAEEIASCQHATFFPHLRRDPTIMDLFPTAAADLLGLREDDELAEPQLLLRFPDHKQDWPLEAHVDSPPEWAGDRRYKGIVGVALTPAGPEDGTVFVWPGSHRGAQAPPHAVPLQAGDALVMHPALAHAGSLNLGPYVRYSVYFRPLGTP
jgi:hypothetical protein